MTYLNKKIEINKKFILFKIKNKYKILNYLMFYLDKKLK